MCYARKEEAMTIWMISAYSFTLLSLLLWLLWLAK